MGEELVKISRPARHSRSRVGCGRCKRRHQKCDEKKPACSSCKESGEPCAYTISLKWGGRKFASSSFGSNASITKCETGEGTFVYVAAPKNQTNQRQPLIPDPTRGIDPLGQTSSGERLLLHHFTQEASRITSCHPQIQLEFCRLLIPMALDYPPLYSALLALSAIHRNSQFEIQREFHNIDNLKAASIQSLRAKLLIPENTTSASSLATILTLCMCEIHSGADKPRSWRTHLEGAKALIESHKDMKSPYPSSTHSLLKRWFVSIEALASITDKGLRAGQFSWDTTTDSESIYGEDDVFLDDYFGFSTDLVPVIKEIGAAAWERRSTEYLADEFASLSEQDFDEIADSLRVLVEAMIHRDTSTPPSFYPGVENHLLPETIEEFRLSNEAYQHAALIHIERRIRLSARSSLDVQLSVKRVLECVAKIAPRQGLSPWIVLTMPLFTAGREALGEDRKVVRGMMERLYESLKLKNIQRSLDFLEASWAIDQQPGFLVLKEGMLTEIPSL